MAENKLRIDRNSNPRKSVFSRLEGVLNLERLFENGLPVKYLPHVLYLTAIGIFYIGNSHYAEKTIRKIDRLQVEVEDLRADYTTLKAQTMFASKQSEMARSVRPLGLKESLKPPHKIVVKKGEY
jgi:hypothetical protein